MAAWRGLRAGLVYLAAAQAALGVAAEGDSSVRRVLVLEGKARVLGTQAGRPGTGRCLGSQVNSGSLWTANALSGCYARANKLVAGRGWGGQGSLSPELLDLGKHKRTKGYPCLPQPGSQETGSGRPCTEGPLGGVGCCVPGPTRLGEPA